MYLSRLIQRAASLEPDAIATINNDRVRTYKESENRIAKLAGGLISLGAKTADRIAILALNSDRYFESCYAIPWAGAVIVPMNTRWSVSELRYSLIDAGVSILIIDDSFADLIEEITDGMDEIHSIIYAGEGDTPIGMHNYEDLVENSISAKGANRGNDDLAGIFYTGGTTGFPKGVMLSHKNLWSNSILTIAEFGGVKQGSWLHIAPMFHLGDIQFVFIKTMGCQKHVFMQAFEPELVMQCIETHNVAEMLFVPMMLKSVLEHPERKNYDLSCLKAIIYGAAPMPESLIREALVEFPGVGFWQGYGQTEMSPLMGLLKPEDHDLDGPNSHRLRAAARPAIGVEMKIVNDNLNEVATGDVGQIMVRGPNGMLGYWNKPEQTNETIVDGWVLTGDAGYFDEERYLFLVDRVKDMIISGGENIFSAEVERALDSHPLVDEAVAIGIPHDKWGETVHAILILKNNGEVTEEEVIQHCRELIAAYKCPRTVEFRVKPFPLSGVGKILKNELRKPYWNSSKQIN